MDRRAFLSHSALALGAGSLLPMAALAGSQPDYKALVCVFLFGGCDSHDLLIGHDHASYGSWARARQPILERFAAEGRPDARSRSSLHPISAGGQCLALPPEAGPLLPLYERGELAFLANAGPLAEPVTRAQIMDGRACLPDKLQSHNDQQSAWQALASEGAEPGWGGRILDAVRESSPYTAVSTNGQSIFLSGGTTRHLQVHPSGRIKRAFGQNRKTYGSEELSARLQAYYGDAAEHLGNPMMRDLIRAQAKAVQDTEVLAQLLGNQDLGTKIRIEGNGLSQQLGTIAELIALHEDLGVTRQVFFAGMGGFDTHKDHTRRMPALLLELSAAAARFQDTMREAGLSGRVTLFTASDFGRTLIANPSGTDHGWGGHHMVVGGAVRGGRVAGTVPPFEPGHDHDFRRGGLIPEVAVEQYGAELARWFGVSDSDLATIFPRLGRFGRAGLNLFR